MPRPRTVQEETCFVSYARADEAFALRLAGDLRAHKVAVWVDQVNIRPSEPWDRAIERTIRACRCMVAIISPRAIASENVADEISLALDSGKTVVPLLIEQCDLPLRLTRTHLIDATSGYDRAFKQSLAEVRSAARAPRKKYGIDHKSEILASASRDLAQRIGPIAGILVERAAARAGSTEDLYNLLTLHIRDEDDRMRFLECMPRGGTATRNTGAIDIDGEPEQGPLSSRERATVTTHLTSFLGPIAPIVVNRESQEAGSFRDLLQRLATVLGSTDDREEFLRRVAAHDGVTTAWLPKELPM